MAIDIYESARDREDYILIAEVVGNGISLECVFSVMLEANRVIAHNDYLYRPGSQHNSYFSFTTDEEYNRKANKKYKVSVFIEGQ